MNPVFEHPLVVAPGDIDDLGHASNLVYLRWMQEAAIAHSSAVGWPSARYHELGAGFVVRAHTIEYLHPAKLGEALVVATWVATMSRVRSLRRYRLERAADRHVLARASTDWAFVDLATLAPRRVPPDVASAFTLLEDEAPGRTDS